jgi:hypothetical protein
MLFDEVLHWSEGVCSSDVFSDGFGLLAMRIQNRLVIAVMMMEDWLEALGRMCVAYLINGVEVVGREL